MSIEIIDNFKYRSRRPNFDRDTLPTLGDMLSVNANWYDDGHIVYCIETGQHYVFKYDEENKDPVTGYFHPLTTESEQSTGSNLWISDEEPDSEDSIWLDTGTDDSGVPVDELLSMQNAILALQRQVNILMNMKTNGVVAGTFKDGARQEMMAAADPVIPDNIKDEYEEIVDGDDTVDELEPDYPEYAEPTTTHISIKTGTWNQLQAHMQDMVNSELIWCSDKKKLYIYQNGLLIAIGSSGDNSNNNDNENTMDKEQIIEIVGEQLQNVSSIGFVPVSDIQNGESTERYIVKVNEEGKLICYNQAADTHAGYRDGYYFTDSVNMSGILINSYYLGGLQNDEHSYQPCSHNFVELSNVYVDNKGKQVDINLNGFYLFYNNGVTWYKLKLWGTIPAGGTFLIRGAQCSVMNANTTRIKINDYDMQWFVTEEVIDGPSTKHLIKFSQDSAVFYLAWANEEGKINVMGSTEMYDYPTGINLIDVDTETCAVGYVDMSSFNNSIYCEKKTYTLPVETQAAEVIFRRWYPLDMVTQSNPDDGVGAHSTVKYLTASKLDASNISEYMDVEELTPKCSWQGKSIATTRSLFTEDYPAVLTNTFGIQATYKDEEHPASRGFCWVSVGYYDEMLKIRKKGTDSWSEFESWKLQDISKTEAGTIGYADIHVGRKDFYERKRWETSYGQSVTTHKIILTGFAPGEYEYTVSRKNDDEYAKDMPIRTFHVWSDEEVANGFTFVQTTDQQGATWEEYEIWNLSAKIMDKYRNDENNPDKDWKFVINTGDICYNGSRSNEWVDYFRGYEPLSDLEEMLTIGNNDLIPIEIRDLGTGKESPWKINPFIIDYFYAVEMDLRNLPEFHGIPDSFPDDGVPTENDLIKFVIPSLYSFTFGKFHFVSVLSEMRTISNKLNVDSDGTTKPKGMSDTTVNRIFGIKDDLRRGYNDIPNTGASIIYDLEEEWLINDMLLWKGAGVEKLGKFSNGITKNNTFQQLKRDELIVNKCGDCVIFTHEMPFNIISNSSYKNYENNIAAPRETAKAYLNRYHNFEYQRLWKLWGIMMVMGGHKHTCALTGPVYDAPLTYNPISKKIANRGEDDYLKYLYGDNFENGDDILNDAELGSDSRYVYSGEFNKYASFQPFIQCYPADLTKYISDTNEIYNNSEVEVTFDFGGTSVTLQPGKYVILTVDNVGYVQHPRCRVEIVTDINSPSYIMCQATGFKNKSNSDLAASNGIIPWERFYVKGDNITEQCRPFFTVYNLSYENEKPKYVVKMYKINGMYDDGANRDGKGSPQGYWNIAERYQRDTLKANRDGYVNNCVVELYNKGNDSSETGTIIK